LRSSTPQRRVQAEQALSLFTQHGSLGQQLSTLLSISTAAAARWVLGACCHVLQCDWIGLHFIWLEDNNEENTVMYVVLEAAEAAFKGSSNCKTTSTVTVLSLLP